MMSLFSRNKCDDKDGEKCGATVDRRDMVYSYDIPYKEISEKYLSELCKQKEEYEEMIMYWMKKYEESVKERDASNDKRKQLQSNYDELESKFQLANEENLKHKEIMKTLEKEKNDLITRSRETVQMFVNEQKEKEKFQHECAKLRCEKYALQQEMLLSVEIQKKLQNISKTMQSKLTSEEQKVVLLEEKIESFKEEAKESSTQYEKLQHSYTKEVKEGRYLREDIEQMKYKIQLSANNDAKMLGHVKGLKKQLSCCLGWPSNKKMLAVLNIEDLLEDNIYYHNSSLAT